MDDILIGTTLGGYQIVEEIGRGGMATVYRAHQLSMNRDVAIKMLPPQFLHQTTSLERFKQEASIVAHLEHRAIVPVHDYGEYEGIPYIVMRYMDGGSVDELLTDGPIPPERTLAILEQIAPALDYAHREAVLHRDLKPSNILLDANGDAYITDFGIARFLGTNPKHLTTSGVVGTPSYMSPEQAQGHELDGRSDIYALGVVLYEMLTGVRPFEGETPYSVAVKHVTEAPPSPCSLNPKLARSIEPVLLKSLAKKPDLRFTTANELAAALKTALENPTTGITILDEMPVTEPSLREALQAGALRRRLADSQPVSPPAVPSIYPPNRFAQQSPSGIQFMPAYVPSYTGQFVRGRKRKTSHSPSWITWAMLALLIGGLLLSVILTGFYLLNSGSSPSSEQSTHEDYNSTAVFKLTATKEALPNSGIPTQPPTNTPRLLPLGSGSLPSSD